MPTASRRAAYSKWKHAEKETPTRAGSRSSRLKRKTKNGTTKRKVGSKSKPVKLEPKKPSPEEDETLQTEMGDELDQVQAKLDNFGQSAKFAAQSKLVAQLTGDGKAGPDDHASVVKKLQYAKQRLHNTNWDDYDDFLEDRTRLILKAMGDRLTEFERMITRLEEAKKKVSHIDPEVLAEMKSGRSPPKVVVHVVVAVMNLLGSKKEDWTSTKRFMFKNNVGRALLNFDPGNVDRGSINRTRDWVNAHRESFVPEKIYHASRSLAPIAGWIDWIDAALPVAEQFARFAAIAEQALIFAQLREKLAELAKVCKAIRELEALLNADKGQIDQLSTRAKEIEYQIQQLQRELSRIQSKLQGLESNRTDMERRLKELNATKRTQLKAAKDLERQLNELCSITKLQALSIDVAGTSPLKGALADNKAPGKAKTMNKEELDTEYLLETVEELRAHRSSMTNVQRELEETEKTIQELMQNKQFDQIQPLLRQAQSVKNRMQLIQSDIDRSEDILRSDVPMVRKLIEQKSAMLSSEETQYAELKTHGAKLFQNENYEEVIQISQQLLEKRDLVTTLKNEIGGLEPICEDPKDDAFLSKLQEFQQQAPQPSMNLDAPAIGNRL